MNIAQIMNLDVGMKGITCSGKITWANKPKNITGTSDSGNDYDFWSQFIVIEDNTGKIGVSITVETDQDSVKKGDMVTVEKAELQEYRNKDNEPTLKLQGKLQYPAGQNTLQNAQQDTQQTRQATKAPQTQSNAPTWQPLDREHVEKDVICALLASRKRPEPEEVKMWTDYIMDGIHPDSKPEAQTNPDHVGDGPEGICPHCQKPVEDCTCKIPF